ncbi:M23 family metallopeptidase [Alcaligenaceae bacterium CGII-47]|nr:M23 family metallopeptidase [Alcaligenaceae bacterium CGII-47]
MGRNRYAVLVNARVILAFVLFAVSAPSGAGPGQGSGVDIAPSGLTAVFSSQVRCPEISSPFASRTRYDGSNRPRSAFGGHHGGMDITLAEGTPLLSLAAGTVVAKGTGGMMEGNYIWLRHAPEDTGLKYWIYTKYQHLDTQSGLELGTAVALGQAIGQSGKTGTVGGHYGRAGYPHLHLTVRKGQSGDQEVGDRGSMSNMQLIDPLQVYHDADRGTADVARHVSASEVLVPYISTDGMIVPTNTRVVWPLACQPVSGS